MPGDTCPLESDLQAFLAGRLAGAGFEQVAEHLESCTHCQEVAERVDPPAPEGVRLLRREPLPPLPATPGQQIGPYLLLHRLGEGGMGIVFRARQSGLGREVALKLMRTGFLDPYRLARFRTEAQALSRLSHPNIIPVFDSGEQDGTPFFVMELAEGGTLAAHTQGKPIPPRQAAAWIEIIATAVHFAHQHGVIHRDLKPANILLTSDGTLKVSDFGLAKLTEGDQLHTITHQILGTPDYMAPEQASGSAVTPAVDIWALGAILYELLTGRPPFPGETALLALNRITTEEPVPPSRLRPACTRDLETICLKCLNKTPSARYSTAQMLADDLRAFLDGRPIVARPIGPVERALKWSRRRPALAVSLLAVVALAALSTLTAVSLHRQQLHSSHVEHLRRLDQADALFDAAPAAVPFALHSLAPHAEWILPRLRERFAAEDAPRRLRAAIGLTALGEPQLDFLLDAVSDAPAAECGNLVLAFRTGGEAALRSLVARARDPSQVRFVILALECGEPGPARERLANADPTPRAAFLEAYRSWHADLAALPRILTEADGDFRSGLCAAVGSVDPTLLDADVRHSLTTLLTRYAGSANDPGSRAAAEWALRQWRLPLPPLDTDEPRGWSVNSFGMTLIDIPPGVHVGITGTVTILPAFQLGDREITLDQFRRCVDDPSYPAIEKPSWSLRDFTRLDPPATPARQLTHDDMLRFCNWLSARAGLQRCYSFDHSGWHFHREADGYRLPVEEEWEYALRAGSETTFPFGDNPRLLPHYAHVGDLHPISAGTYLPNRWGLFDMLGNVSEICWNSSHSGPRLSATQTTPSAPLVWVARGGSFDSGCSDCRSIHRLPLGHVAYPHLGFRVARTNRRTRSPSPLQLLTTTLQRRPGDRALLFARSDLHARAGRWDDAARDRGDALATDPGYLDHWLRQAPLLALAQHRTLYDRHRTELLRRFRSVSDPREADRVAYACLLLPYLGDESGTVAILIERAQKAGPDHPHFGAFLVTAALADLRDGRDRRATERAAAALETSVVQKSPELRERAALVRAMALYRQRQLHPAREAWLQVQSLATQRDQRLQSSKWFDTALTLPLWREAETLFRSD